MKLKSIIFALLLTACGQDCTPRKMCVRSHIETRTRDIQVCVKSHMETVTERKRVWCYHWGYSLMKGKFCWHWGYKMKDVDVQKEVCDEYVTRQEQYEAEVCDKYEIRKPEGCK